MNKYLAVLMLLALFGCVNKVENPQVKNFQVVCKEYRENPTKLVKDTTLTTYLDVQQIVVADTVTYIYSDGNVVYNDTLKIYNGSFQINGEKIKYPGHKHLQYNGKKVKIYQLAYADFRSAVFQNFYVNDSLGVILKKKILYGGTSIVECGTEKELQGQIIKDNIFFQFRTPSNPYGSRK